MVITSVTRDDLQDGGSAHFAATIRAVRAAVPQARIEVLTPDFQGDANAIARVIGAQPHIFNHNLETVARLYPSFARAPATGARWMCCVWHATTLHKWSPSPG